jgi:ribose 1,5-bisphosphokinase PhnN
MKTPRAAVLAYCDVVGSALYGLSGPSGVGKDTAAHGHKIAHIVLERRIGLLRRFDTTDTDHRHRNPLADRFRELQESLVGRFRRAKCG